MKADKRIKLVVIIAVLFTVCALTLVSCGFDGIAGGNADVLLDDTKETVNIDAGTLEEAYVAAVKQVKPSVCAITVQVGNSIISGSGTIATSSGYVFTNNHVVEKYVDSAQNAIMISMFDANGDIVNYAAEIVMPSNSHTVDFAVLRITHAIDESYRLIALGDAEFNPVEFKKDLPDFAESMFMFGNAAGLGLAVAEAMVANPSVPNPNTPKTPDTLIQLDAPVNHGNSGGGLFNLKGEYCGIVTYRKEGDNATSGLVQNIGYAIETDELLTVTRACYPEVYSAMEIV